MRLSQAAAAARGELYGADHRFDRVVIDSRQTNPGDLFVAIRGARLDGHDFIAQARARGAVGAMVMGASVMNASAGVETSSEAINAPTPARIEVDDTTAALGQLAAHWRRRFDPTLVAITGSNGKTTVSALLASILNHCGNCGTCLCPQGSFNNQWGVPLTLLRLREQHTHAIIEMGMNRPGEIEYLSGLTQPTIALITNAAQAHLAGLGNLQSIAAAKGEIFSGLARTGTAVLNADDPFHDYWRTRVRAERVLSFGLGEGRDDAAHVQGKIIASDAQGSEFELVVTGHPPQDQKQTDAQIRVRLPLLGKHNVANAVAASAVAHVAGATLEQIKLGLEVATAVPGRLNAVPGHNGALIIDDSYNANPDSLQAGLGVLAAFGRERIAVLGVMAELGDQSDDLHFQAGAYARRCGIEQLLCLGATGSSAMAGYARGFGSGAQQFATVESLLQTLLPMLKRGVTVLVKGSRSAGMERVVTGLRASPGASGASAALPASPRSSAPPAASGASNLGGIPC